MRKIWFVIQYEYKKRVVKKSFLFGTLLLPIMFGIIISVTVYIVEHDKNTSPLGYVDHSGLLSQRLLPEIEDGEVRIEFIAFQIYDQALIALENGEIQAFYLIPENYLESGKVDLYYWDEYPDQSIREDFNKFIRANLVTGKFDEVQTRIIEGINLTLHSSDGNRKFNEESGIVAILFPMAVAVFFIFAVMGASGYFLQAITDEKENKTMEIIITSISSWKLIGGKSLGLISVALTQILIWVTTLILFLTFAPEIFPNLQGSVIPWDVLIVFILFFVPSFALIGGLMIAIGGAVSDLQEGQQIAGILNLLFTFPLFLTALVVAEPNSPILIFLSFWPSTSFLMITLRWSLTIIPIWQIIISWLILVLTGFLINWAAARIFRLGMLRYGKRLSLKAVFNAVRYLEIRQSQ
jgi:ABC-2 type transport system permease protein